MSNKRGDKKANDKYDYTFKAKDDSMVDFNEIEVTREKPMAVVQSNKGMNVILVHGTLEAKANLLDMHKSWMGYTGLIECKSAKQLGKRLSKLKKIMVAPWPKNSTTSVRVKLIGAN